MTEHAGRPIRGYSKGMRQRIKLAQAMVHDPLVLFLDEPLTGTDPVARRELIDVIVDWGRQGRTVLVSSHIFHEVQAVTRSIVLLNRGRLVALGDVRQIRDLIDEHPHRIVLRSSRARELAAKLVRCDDVVGVELKRGRRRDPGRDPAARPVLRAAGRPGPRGRHAHRRGLFRRRQPGSRLQVPGDPMTIAPTPIPPPHPEPAAATAGGRRRSRGIPRRPDPAESLGRSGRAVHRGADHRRAAEPGDSPGGPRRALRAADRLRHADPPLPGPVSARPGGERPALRPDLPGAGAAGGPVARLGHGAGRHRGADADLSPDPADPALGDLPGQAAGHDRLVVGARRDLHDRDAARGLLGRRSPLGAGDPRAGADRLPRCWP